jgi:hypothetical protein
MSTEKREFIGVSNLYDINSNSLSGGIKEITL